MFNPFPNIDPRYGTLAVLHRRGDNPSNLLGVKRLHAKHQGGGCGYDKGGAYWGHPCNVWAVWGYVDGKRYITFVRASIRDEAIHKVREGE